ncbi:MAG TPA: trypsin-like peptidase domain-containing protein [Planctomycetota bacterium]|nr:trypsin-like peptidase domain-containing protein [Planctomycetota bacterium]
MTKTRLALSALLLVAAAASHAATENESTTISTALQAEEELTRVIEKANAAFVFVGGGSGICVSPDGYILTNHHVAGDRKQWAVRIEGTGRMMMCDLVGTDPVGDLALLKVRNGKDLAYVEFGDINKVRVGQQVLAMGDPFKLADLDGPPSVSLGTVSALHRFQGNYSDAIQTDCAVNPGNSGGPLLTLDGKLIGITGQIMSRFGAKANTGIGYAIPVDQILRFFPLLKEAGGKVVYHGTIPDGLSFVNRVDETQAAVVESVDAKTDAERAGFRAKDRIVSIDGKPVYNYARLIGIVRSYPENSVLEVEVDRDGARMNLKMKLPRMQIPNKSFTEAD